jgi:hypothetical protein
MRMWGEGSLFEEQYAVKGMGFVDVGYIHLAQ